MKVALLQQNYVVGDLTGNVQRLIQGIHQAAQQDADLIVTSELAITGYPPRDLLLAPGFVQQVMEELERLVAAIPRGIPVIVGTIAPRPQRGGRPLYNAAAWISEGAIQHWIYKSLLPTYDIFDEDRYFQPASDSVQVIDWGGYRWGITICEDLWNDPETGIEPRYHRDPIRECVAAGATHILNLSASPFERDKLATRIQIAQTLAKKYGIRVFYVNQVGSTDDLIFDGGSFAVNPQGQMVAQGCCWHPDLVMVEETALPVKMEERDPSADLYAALVLGTRDYVQKCGFQRVVLGLSGGIDSALTAAIAVQALGAEHVLGVLLPSPYSSPSSFEDAYDLATRLGIPTMKLPIQPIMESFERTLAEPFQGMPPDLTEENLQSRIRGTLLMALSNKLGHLLLTTGNKSELAVGYCTLYGDMCGALGVIGDLYKTEVYALAQWLNREQEIIPWHCIHKPPSAELRPDQQDQDSLPPYEILDAILRLHLEQHQTAAEIMTAGWEAQTVHRILKLVQRAEFKRRQAAPTLKVSPRAFGTGWRMPIARSHS